MDESVSALQKILSGRYDLDRLVGRGGMADVYLARDVRHNREVAVKVLRAREGYVVNAERFSREIETAARLQHPNILPVYDSGQADGFQFFVMPSVDGPTLRKRMEGIEPLLWPQILTVAREVGEALGFAHARGVVHRDIKPENILFFGGHAVVTDFGIALAITDAPGERLTLEGHGVGTPEYMSPEQAFGESVVDARSDVYSLGCVLYEMLSGSPPWGGKATMAILLHKTRDAPPALVLGASIGAPPHVVDVVMRALANDPADRYRGVQQFMEDLENREGEGNSTPSVATVRNSVPAAVEKQVTQAPHASIAVLPFVNVGGEPADEILSDGLAEELIYALARVSDLHVVARTSSFQFRNYQGDIRSVGRELKVSSLLEGSVRRQGNRLRVTARLIDAQTGFEKWSQRFDKDFTDVFAIQDEISRAIVNALEATIHATVGTSMRVKTADMTAYEMFLEARFHWSQRTTASIARSQELLSNAIERDPSFADAKAALAETLVTLAVYGAVAPTEVMPRARGLALDAVVRQANPGAAHGALGCILGMYDHSWGEAEQHFQSAVQLSSAAATAAQWYAANLLLPMRRFDEAHTQLRNARAIDPISPSVWCTQGLAYHAQGDHATARQVFSRIIERHPQFGMAHYFLARVQADEDDTLNAIASLDRADMLLGDSTETLAARGVVLGLAGREADAAQILHRLDSESGNRYVSQVMRAEIEAAIGNNERCLTRLDEALLQHATDLVWIGSRKAFAAIERNLHFRSIAATVGIASG